MRHYIGIDLGTTNSAICSYDGTNVRVWKSPEQNDVTPSAIFSFAFTIFDYAIFLSPFFL